MYQVDLEDYVARPDRISGADINAICQEAGMHAVRENRYFCRKLATEPYKVDSNALQRLPNVRLFLTLGFLSRYIVLPKDFEAGYKNNIKKDESEHEFYK